MSNGSEHAKTEADTSVHEVRVRRVMACSAGDMGVVTLGAEDFAQLEECMTHPAGPNQAMIKAAELHRNLTSRR